MRGRLAQVDGRASACLDAHLGRRESRHLVFEIGIAHREVQGEQRLVALRVCTGCAIRHLELNRRLAPIVLLRRKAQRRIVLERRNAVAALGHHRRLAGDDRVSAAGNVDDILQVPGLRLVGIDELRCKTRLDPRSLAIGITGVRGNDDERGCGELVDGVRQAVSNGLPGLARRHEHDTARRHRREFRIRADQFHFEVGDQSPWVLRIVERMYLDGPLARDLFHLQDVVHGGGILQRSVLRDGHVDGRRAGARVSVGEGVPDRERALLVGSRYHNTIVDHLRLDPLGNNQRLRFDLY